MQQALGVLESAGHTEEAFLALEAVAARLQAAVRSFTGEVRKFVAAAQTGNVAGLTKTKQALSARYAELQDAESSLQSYDIGAIARAIGTPAYVQEILDATTKIGLKDVRASRNAILSYPHRVVFDSATGYHLGYRSVGELRPSTIARTLKSEREKITQISSGYLESLRAAYLLVSKGESGISVALPDLYSALTMLPGAKRAYPEADFIRDLGVLDERGPKVTRDGFQISFPASTSARSNRAYTVVNVRGQEVPYASIRFDPVKV